VSVDAPVLEIANLTKRYGSPEHGFTAIEDLSFSVARGEFVCVVGPSGSGKTTLLKCLSGLLPPTAGTARLHGELITAPPKALGLVFQDYSRSLLPWMNVRRNVLLPLRGKSMDRAQAARLVEEAIEAVGLTHVIDRYPWQLSGGMQQRVAIARSLAYQPEILLMDEPFASLDAQARADLEDLVLRVWNEFKVTVVFVTHDIDESVYLADRVVVLTPSPGSVREMVDVPLPRPRNQIETKELPDFVHLRAHVYRLVKRELEAAEPVDALAG
jgi:NitT/TauT family transport system ATP-binding protein